MSKPMRESAESMFNSMLPELAEKLLKAPLSEVCDASLIELIGSRFHLFEDQRARVLRAVTGLKVTQVRAVPSRATLEEWSSLERQIRKDLRYAWTCVKALWVGLDAFAQIYGIPLCQRDFRESAALMLYLASFGLLEAWFKWSTCHVSAWCLGELELPDGSVWPSMSPFEIWQGFRKWLRRQVPRNRIGTKWAASIGFSVLQLKRSALPVPDYLVTKAYAEHKAALCAEPPPIKMRWVRAVVRTVRETFQEFRLRVGQRPPIPSSSAHYSRKRADGGALGELHDLKFQSLRGNFLERMIEVAPGEVVETRSLLLGEELEFFYKHLRLADDNLCRPSAVLEALKVRMITCGSELRYWRAHEVAKQIRRRLASHPTFMLTRGAPVEQALHHMLRSIPSLFSCRRPWFCSGDYKAATDNLHRELSLVALREIFACGGRLDASAFEADLTDHLMDYEQVLGEGLSRQQNGQLMGSPLSFPILNVINAAVTRDVLERVHRRPLTLVESGIVCNGDDILFPLPDRFHYEKWKKAVSQVGLKPSPGKNYFLQNFTVINSQCHFVDYSSRLSGNPWADPSFVPVEHLAMGNFRGQGRVLESKAKLLEAMGRPVTVADNVNVLLLRAGDRAQKVLTQLLKVNDNFKQFKVVDWFLPRSFGGLGIWPIFRHSAPDLRKLVFADYLARENRNFQCFTEAVQESLGSYLRSIQETEWYEHHGLRKTYGLFGKLLNGDNIHIMAKGGVAAALQSLDVSFGNVKGVHACASPIWRDDLDGRTIGDTADLPSLPGAFRSSSFMYEEAWGKVWNEKDQIWEKDEEEERQKGSTRDFAACWRRSQVESPRTREIKNLIKQKGKEVGLAEVEELLWAYRSDFRPNEQKHKISHFNSGC